MSSGSVIRLDTEYGKKEDILLDSDLDCGQSRYLSIPTLEVVSVVRPILPAGLQRRQTQGKGKSSTIYSYRTV